MTNQTADLYRYFDVKEAEFLECYDRFNDAIQTIVDMVGPTVD